jgi:hypothetical protein
MYTGPRLLPTAKCREANPPISLGDYVDASGVKMTLVERWDGTAWSIQTSANPSGGGVLSSVSCRGNRCMAVGQSAGSTPLAERWNGTAWVVQTLPAGGGTLSGVSCTAGNACTAVGQIDSSIQETRRGSSGGTGRPGRSRRRPTRTRGTSSGSQAACWGCRARPRRDASLSDLGPAGIATTASPPATASSFPAPVSMGRR